MPGRLDRERRGLKHRAEKWMPVFGESDAKTRSKASRPIPESGGLL
jgi:hypothetical protein